MTYAPIREKILEAINTGHVSMRPRWYFVLMASLVAIGGVIVFFTVVYLASFIIFVLRRNGILFVPAFGVPGWLAFLTSLPWILIGLLLIFVAVLDLLVSHYDFAHHRPLLVSASVIFGIVAIGGIAVAATPLHSRVFGYVERHPFPVAGPIYHMFGNGQIRMIHPGKINATTTDGFDMRTHHGDDIHIIITSSTQFPFGEDFVPGDKVVVFGDRDGVVVTARGVREVDTD
jgi:hypothetical protein